MKRAVYYVQISILSAVYMDCIHVIMQIEVAFINYKDMHEKKGSSSSKWSHADKVEWFHLHVQLMGPMDHSHFDMFPPDTEEPPDELSGWDKDFWTLRSHTVCATRWSRSELAS